MAGFERARLSAVPIVAAVSTYAAEERPTLPSLRSAWTGVDARPYTGLWLAD
jgi:hypothetical protein